MSDILSLADTLEPNVALFKGDLQKIAKIHATFYKFYIRLATKCDALAFDKRSQDYLESCINYLENKKLSKKGIQQSRNNCLKILDSLGDLCVTLGNDKNVLAGLHKLIDQAVVDDEKGRGTLDLLQQLKNLLNAPGDTNDNDNSDGKDKNDGRTSPMSTASTSSQEEALRNHGGVVPMEQYLLSDSGMDSYYHKYNKDIKNFALTSEMNQIMSRASDLRQNSYVGLDSLLAKMRISVPIWNYHVDRVDAIDSSNVMDNMEIFSGNKSVTDAVLYSCPDYLKVGPFDVYVRNKVYVYHCLVNDCNNCMTTSLEFLKLHVKFQHGESDVDWNCTDCDLIKLHSSCQKSLDGALDHLAKQHSIKSTYTLAKERLLEINQKIMGEDSTDLCPQPIKAPSEDNSDLFHCPNRECGFLTNSLAVAFGHYASVLSKNATAQCRYCDLVSYSTYELCEHSIKEHGNANYKCSLCPYRSVSKANCVYHQRDLHPGSSAKIIGVEPLQYCAYNYSCRAHNSIKPFVCNDSCNFGTMISQKFNNHILKHPGMMVTCHYCEQYHTDDMSELIDHFLSHGVGEYHCMYCKSAFNFIAKIERHLHEKHPSQYPFIILCQDYDVRSMNLSGKYDKLHKLDVGGESLVVLPLESEKSVIAAPVTSQTESILIQEVDHCKMQLKTFLKNKEEPEEMPYVPPLPHVEEVLDLTASEDPRERLDIKPRLRVRTVEELTAQAPIIPPSDQSKDQAEESHEVATFYAFSEPTVDTCQVLEHSEPMMTPAQIKQERLCRQVENENSIECDIEQITIDETLSSIQIKREVHDAVRPPSKMSINTNLKSPKKVNTSHISNTHIKMEHLDIRETHSTTPNSQKMEMEKRREDQNAVAMLISQEVSRQGSTFDGKSDRASLMDLGVTTRLNTPAAPHLESSVPSDCMVQPTVPAAGDSGGSHDTDPAVSLMSNQVMSSIGNIVRAPMLDSIGQETNLSMLEGIVPPETPDIKPFETDALGDLNIRPHYMDLKVVDTVIISSDGEDDYDEASDKSSLSTPSCSRSTSPTPLAQVRFAGSASVPTPKLSSPIKTSFSVVPKLAKIFPAPGQINDNPTYLLVDTTTAVNNIVTAPNTTMATASKPLEEKPISYPSTITAVIQSPAVDVKRYRCKVCTFVSNDRQVTYKHLQDAHPSRFSKQFIKVPPLGTEEALINAVSCPYCPDVVYEGIKSFERHHAQQHFDFSEIKCFLVYNPKIKVHPAQIFACCFCGRFCQNEEAVWQHVYAVHSSRIATLKKPLHLKFTVALKKMVCPLYTCLDEFLDPNAFKAHVNSHSEVIACKKCTYIADSVEEFLKFHMKIDPEDRLLHFYYTQSAKDRANLLNVRRFSNPLYMLSAAHFKEKTTAPGAAPNLVRKTTARKSTGGAQYR